MAVVMSMVLERETLMWGRKGGPRGSWTQGLGPKERSWPEKSLFPHSSLRVCVTLESSTVHYLIARCLTDGA